MTKRLNFTIGSDAGGYKSIEITIDGGSATYKILRGGLLNVGKKISPAMKISDEVLAELDALNIFAWEENYSAKGNVLWSLTYDDGEKFYRGRGTNFYPDEWTRFLDWLDALIPELEFVHRRRLEHVSFEYRDEKISLDREAKTFTLDKKISRHIYDLNSNNTKKFFDACQKMIDGRDVEDADLDSGSRVAVEIVRHDRTTENFETLYNENFLPGLTNFLEELHGVASDLSAEIFSPPTIDIAARQNKFIFCKVQFKGSYKHYTYRTDDETLAVGDVVDVPVGRNNDVNQARIVEIGYFDEYEAPFPIDRIKKIIGKHVGDDWENY